MDLQSVCITLADEDSLDQKPVALAENFTSGSTLFLIISLGPIPDDHSLDKKTK